jgi:LEA14-like dessication related protein
MKRKKLLTILLVSLFLINIISLSFIFFDFKVIRSPETIVEIKVKNITDDEIQIETIVRIKNPNVFDISIKNLKITTFTEDNFEIGILKLDGGDINSGDSKVFSSSDVFGFDGHDFKRLRTKINTDIAVKILGFFEKSIPLDVTVLTNVEDVVNNLKAPVINFDVEFDDINKNGANFTAEISFFNPNSFQIYVDNLNLSMENSNVRTGFLSLKGNEIRSNGYLTITAEGDISYKTIDAGRLFLNLTGIAGVRIGGIEQDLDISAISTVDIPRISEFVFNGERIDFDLPVQFEFKALGVVSTVGFKIYNPSKIPLVGENLVCSIYRLDNGDKHLLSEKNMESCPIAPYQRVCVETELLVPYWRFFTSGSGQIVPDKLILGIDGDLSIANTSQNFPISVEAYVDPHLLNPKDIIFEE